MHFACVMSACGCTGRHRDQAPVGSTKLLLSLAALFKSWWGLEHGSLPGRERLGERGSHVESWCLEASRNLSLSFSCLVPSALSKCVPEANVPVWNGALTGVLPASLTVREWLAPRHASLQVQGRVCQLRALLGHWQVRSLGEPLWQCLGGPGVLQGNLQSLCPLAGLSANDAFCCAPAPPPGWTTVCGRQAAAARAWG